MMVVLAHQGGWDEALLVVVPLAVLAGLLIFAYLRSAPDEDESRDQT